MNFTTIDVTGTVIGPANTPVPGATVSLTPTAVAAAQGTLIAALSVSARTVADGSFSVAVIPVDSTGLPSGLAYTAQIVDSFGRLIGQPLTVQPVLADGPSVDLFSLANLASPPPVGSQFVSGLVAGSGVELSPASGTGVVTVNAAAGAVDSVTAGDGTITVGGTTTNPTVEVTAGTFDPAGAASAAQAGAEAASLAKSANLSDLPDVSTARTNLGLGSAATKAASAFDAAGAASAAEAAAEAASVPLAGGTMTGPLTLSQDATGGKQAVAFEQLGSAAFDAATAFDAAGAAVTAQANAEAASVPLSTVTAAGDLIVGSAAGAVARLPLGTPNQVLAVNPGGTGLQYATPASGGSGLTQVATTGPSGYALVNSTGSILTWTAPNDGNLHTVLAVGELMVTSATTGGGVASYDSSSGWSAAAVTGTKGTGRYDLGTGSNYGHDPIAYAIQPGSTFSIQQNTAMTAGAATLYATIYAQ